MTKMEPAVTKKRGPSITFDLSDPTDAQLARCASRIGKLLTTPGVAGNPDIQCSLDDFLGAVYALIRAKQKQFRDRPDRNLDIRPVAQRAARIAAGHMKTDGLWIGGFYFNNVHFCTAAINHRVLQVVAVPMRGGAPTLQTEALVRHGGWNSIRLHKVHCQVNELKHEPQGVYGGRLVSYADALTAACDLLDLIEAWTATQIPPARTP